MTVDSQYKTPSAFVIPLVLFLVAIGLCVALLTAQTALVSLCVLVITMTAGAKAWSRVGLSRLHSALTVDKKKMFPSEQLALGVDVVNSKLLPVWLQVTVPLDSALQIGFGDGQLKKDTGLLSYQRVSFNWNLTALARGVHSIGPVELEAGDPFGFFPRKKKRYFLKSSCFHALSR